MSATKEQVTAYKRFDTSKRVIFSPRLTEKNARDTWVVQGGLSFYMGQRSEERWVGVPDGYRVTGAIVHPFLHNWLAPNRPGGQAAIVHNYLCNTGKIRENGIKRVVTRQEANEIFLHAMKVCNVSRIKRTILYWSAVRLANRSEPIIPA